VTARPPLWSSGQSSWLHNGDVLWFLWGTNWIYICYVEESGPPLLSSGQSSWLMNGEVLCFLWGTNWIFICYVEESRSALWSTGQSSWLLNRDVIVFLWGTNWIYICHVKESSGIEHRDYGRRGSDSLTIRHPSIRKCWHYLRRQADVARSV
jgi:hypothetical protein